MAKLNVNGKTVDVKVDGNTPLLWALREQVGLTGELSRHVPMDDCFGLARFPQDLDRPAYDDDARERRRPRLEEDFTGGDVTRYAIRGESRDMLGYERRKDVVATFGSSLGGHMSDKWGRPG